MGDVYLAQDKLLERKVALKLLNKKYADDEERHRRFVTEAKSASALNHPNIITIYEIGESAGMHFIVTEFIDGQTVHERMLAGPLSIAEILDIGIQTAAALSAAHDARITHRDIKPENIMIRNDGYVKVLDFGLAKLTEHRVEGVDFDANTQRLFETNPGSVLGTVSHMSPEQSRGKNVDQRTDIWSLGVVLYEMITGKLPFTGETTSDVLAAVLRAEPAPISSHLPHIPKELEHVVGKTLRKNRNDRYQNVKDLMIDLKDLRQDADIIHNTPSPVSTVTGDVSRVSVTDEPFAVGPITAGEGTAISRSVSDVVFTGLKLHPILSLGGAAVLLAGLFFGVNRFIPSGSVPELFQEMQITKLTSEGNIASGEAAISPEGKYTAYVVRETDGRSSLWMRNVATSSSVQISPASDSAIQDPRFSPDGNYVFYVQVGESGTHDLFKVPVPIGQKQLVMNDVHGPISFSPNEREFAFVRDGSTLMIADADGSNAKTVAKVEARDLWMPAWSPDGTKIVISSLSQNDAIFRLSEFTVNDGTERMLPVGSWLRVNGLAWLPDGNSLVLLGRSQEHRHSQLWKISYPDGAASRITNDAGNYFGLGITADGKTIVTAQEVRTTGISVISSSGVISGTVKGSKDTGLSGLAWTPDGRIVYTTRIIGLEDLWIMDRDGRNNRQLTQNSGANFHPVVSPDGLYIYFISDRTGTIDLWRMDVNGNNPLQITANPEVEAHPGITPDGRWIVYQRIGPDNKSSVWKMNTDGSPPVQISEPGSGNPKLSPDGRFVAADFYSRGPGWPGKLRIFSIDDGTRFEPFAVPKTVEPTLFRWSADGKSLLYTESRNFAKKLWSQPFAGGQPRVTADIKPDQIYTFDVSVNGHGIAIAGGSETADVVTIRNF